jgi:hypothetical protein
LAHQSRVSAQTTSSARDDRSSRITARWTLIDMPTLAARAFAISAAMTTLMSQIHAGEGREVGGWA